MRAAARRAAPALFLCLLAACASRAPAERERAARPNVVLILADDLRRDAVGAYGPHAGEAGVETPNIDALAQRGVRFDGAYCMGSRHGAVCAPSRAMLLSGRHLPRVRDDLRDAVTLPEVLRDSGYRTLFAGKWHNGKAALRGFDAARAVMLGGMSDHFTVPLTDLDPVTRAMVPREASNRHSSELFADAAIELLEGAAPGGQPFFLMLSFTAPHDPRDAPEAYRRRFTADPPPLPPNFLPQVPWDADDQWGKVRDEKLLPWPRPEGLLRQQLAEYRALVAHMDRETGRVLSALERLGLAGDTVVVFTSDHGLALGSHGLLGKQNVFEHSMAVPLVVAGPGVERAERTGALAYLHDVFATVCALAGAAPPPDTDALDLSPALRGAPFAGRPAVMLAYRGSQRAVRAGDLKLIRFPEIDRTLLFDVAADPFELRDLSSAPGSAARIARLRALLEEQQRACGDVQPWTSATLRPAQADYTGNPRAPDRWQPAWIRAKYFANERGAR